MVMRMLPWIAALALTASCVADRTEIVVSVDTDLRAPDLIDEIQITVEPPDSAMPRQSVARLGAGEPPLPRTLGLVHESGPLGPFAIRVAGRRGGADVIERRARTSFVEGRTLLLRMDLLGACVGVTCGEGLTCKTGGCSAIDVAPENLPEWSGTPTPLDGSAPGQDAGPREDAGDGVDAGGSDAGCVPATESCNGTDDDCDGMVDEGFPLTTPDNCGACGNRCAPPDRDCCDGVCGRC